MMNTDKEIAPGNGNWNKSRVPCGVESMIGLHLKRGRWSVLTGIQSVLNQAAARFLAKYPNFGGSCFLSLDSEPLSLVSLQLDMKDLLLMKSSR